jgi:hypothetical protein
MRKSAIVLQLFVVPTSTWSLNPIIQYPIYSHILNHDNITYINHKIHWHGRSLLCAYLLINIQ